MGVATGVALAGVAVSAYSAHKAAKDKKKAAKALEDLKTPEATNVAENLTVSTRGADLRKEEAGRNSASAVDALRGGGARAIIGGIGNVQANNNAVSAEIGANLDEQQKDIDKMKANDEIRIQGIGEDRYKSDVASLSSQIDEAENTKRQAIGSAVQGLGSAAQSFKTYQAGKGLTKEQKLEAQLRANKPQQV